jgi:thiol-disulfide isomerase/thioredoxin
MKKIYLMSFLILTAIIFSGCSSSNQDQTENQPEALGVFDEKGNTVVYFFWGDGCPHCENQKPFLEEMENKYPDLEIKMFETWSDRDNAELFQEMAEAYGIEARGVPATFIGEAEPIIGYRESMNENIEQKISDCIENGCISPADKLK